jgi:formate-dependent nitrite reductase cytochrome c552 subunit
VRLTDPQGRVREYRVSDVSDEAIARGERRRMDCMDCHNRPSHPFDPSAERAVDGAIALGDISRGLPFVRREAVGALTASYESQEAAEARIAEGFRTFYAKNYPSIAAARAAEIERAVRRTQALYRRNVFPRMNVTWGTYPNNIGHSSGPGCFRCHDDNHKSREGAVIRQDCELCHTIE